MEDQNRNIPETELTGVDAGQISSIPAYQVLDHIEETAALDAAGTMAPVEGVPSMPGMQPQTMPSVAPQQGYVQMQQPAYMQPQQYAYPAPQQPQQPVQVQQTYAYPQQMQPQYMVNGGTKFCKFCAAKIPSDAVICTACGRQVEMLSQQMAQPIVINNTNDNVINAPVNVSNQSTVLVAGQKPKDKWASFFLCLFFGYFGVHKFYEGKPVMGIVYLFSAGLCGIGWLVDLILILLKPNPYYV